MGRVGVIGGTFDPPHVAHLMLAEQAREALGLDRVLFAPVGDPPHKDSTRTPAALRVQMVKLAIADNPHFVLSRIDVDRDGPHYTVDMLTLLRAQYPMDTLYFLMGADSFENLPTWGRARELYRLPDVHLVVGRRLGAEALPDESMHRGVLDGLEEVVIVIDAPVAISSTKIVQRIRAGQSIRYLVTDAVRTYIQANGLYKDSEA
jgi:nicotinate-nucleotide adenylyltransferase